ncbi:MBOAT family O-acyltransferase [Aureibaculum marinum]|uniref:MBOAT family O-acyltransferase n=1 Tax=Aureibaculum marinum TaxID=2487930 RepID=UPI00193ACED5|nr:MBOAT family O-acyltransferase [Aureibaculum marinum]
MFYNKPILDVLLPVGISFYTFQTLSYTIDVYRGNTKPERHFGKFAVFVSFFPQLVAGPIERSNRFIPMLKKKKKLSYHNISEGFKIMLWGFFMKLVVADRLSIYVDMVYNDLNNQSSLTIITASSFFLFQIYCDFAGYSYIAIGAAKIMGIDLMENFRRPNLASSIGDLWNRWHISLSTWFRDYVYIPLGGNRVSIDRFYLNLFLTFLISGLWHGANWTFVLWGVYHGMFMVMEVFLKKNVKISFLRKFNFTILGIIIVFIIKVGSYFFFRANSVSDSFFIFRRVFYDWKPGFSAGDLNIFILCLVGITILTLIEIKQEYFPGKFLILHNKNYYIRLIGTAIFIAIIFYLGVFDGGQFIYFQF